MRAPDDPDADEEEFKARIRAQYEHQGHPYYSTARLWDDGVIDPARHPHGARAWPCPPPPTRPLADPAFGVFRM